MPQLDHCATGVRIIAAVLLEASPVAHDDTVDRRGRILAAITKLADTLQDGTLTIGSFLSILNEYVDAAVRVERDATFVDSLRAFQDELSARHAVDRCALCAKYRPDASPLCAELDSWPRSDPAHICIGQAAHLLQDLEQRARKAYSSHADELKRTPVRFSIQHVAHGQELGFIPEFHLDGKTRATDGASVVEIVLEERSLDLCTLRQLAYVCAHELVCHAFQGVQGQTRRDVGAACSWSEGWMDGVTWLLLQEWLNDGTAKQVWLTGAPSATSTIDDCREVHKRRYQIRQGRLMDPENIHRRKQARDACERLYQNWSGAGLKRRLRGLSKLVKFSAKVNVAPLARKEREELVIELVSGLLLSRNGHLLDRTVLVCEEYLNDPKMGHEVLLEKLRANGVAVYPRGAS